MKPELVAPGRDTKPEKPRDSEGDRENGRSGMMETEMEIPRKKDIEMRKRQRNGRQRKMNRDAKRNRHRKRGRKVGWGRERDRRRRDPLGKEKEIN